MAGGFMKGILSSAGSTLGANPLGAVLGTGQLIAGAIQKKKAQSILPAPEDVGERQLLNTLRRRQQALTTGTAYNPQVTAGKQMARSLAKSSFQAGGPVYNNLISQTMGNIAQQTSQDIAQTLAQQGQLTTQMANRKADLTLLQRNEKMADAARLQQTGFQNVAASVMPQNKLYTDPAAEYEALKKRMKEIDDQMKKKPTTEEEDLEGNTQD